MRDIKFRGITTKGEMIYGSLVVTTHGWPQHTKTWIIENSFGNGGWFLVKGRQYVRPETVGQFIGIHDKNGKEIYEGDIVYEWYGHNRSKSPIVITNMIDAVNQQNDFGAYYEIVGNLHQSPELVQP